MEVFAGYRFEIKTGTTLRKPRFGESGDFVDSAGIQWDIKGPLRSQGNFDGFLQSIRNHFTAHPNGDERIIVDVAGLDTLQVQRVKNLLSS